MCLPGVELAALADSHYLCDIGNCGWPVETLSKRVAHEGAWCGVVTADADVDVPDQLLALGDRDAALQDARGTALVQLSVDHDKRLGSPSDASRLSAVRW